MGGESLGGVKLVYRGKGGGEAEKSGACKSPTGDLELVSRFVQRDRERENTYTHGVYISHDEQWRAGNRLRLHVITADTILQFASIK